MGRMFKGRPIIPGEVKGEAIVSRQGLNILATFQKAIILRQKKATGNDTVSYTHLTLPTTPYV